MISSYSAAIAPTSLVLIAIAPKSGGDPLVHGRVRQQIAGQLPPEEGLQGQETAAPGDVITVYRTRRRENRPLNALHS
jgi:hypothetical protein